MPVPQIIPVSDMRNRHNEVFDKLANGPVFLTRHGTGEAVLLSMKQWESLLTSLEEHADIIDVLEAELAAAQSGEGPEPFTAEERASLAAAKHAVPA